MSRSVTPGSVTLFGRSSSHFTRVVRLLAAELGIEPAFVVVPSLLSLTPADYGGNPALRMPVLHGAGGVWYGALNCARVLARLAGAEARVVWPEDLLHSALLANAQELAVQAMSTEVSMIMSEVASPGRSDAHTGKQRESLLGSLAWLDEHVDEALGALPPGRLVSFLEVTLFCLLEHLEFRSVCDVTAYGRLGAFRAAFGARPAARATVFRFDA